MASTRPKTVNRGAADLAVSIRNYLKRKMRKTGSRKLDVWETIEWIDQWGAQVKQ